MSTSGIYSFAVTRDDIIRQAMLNIGKLDPYETPDSRQTSDAALLLNMLVKQMMGKTDFAAGLKVWSRKRGYLFLSTSTGRYTLSSSATGWTNNPVFTTLAAAALAGATSVTLTSATGVATGYNIGIIQTDGSLAWTTISGLAGAVATIPGSALTVGASAGATVYIFQSAAQSPVYIEAANLRDSQYVDVPLKIIRSVQEYEALPSKAQVTFQQDPTAIWWESGINTSTLFLDCGSAQDLTKYIVLTYLEPVQDFTTTTDAPYYPQEFFLCLCWELSKLMAPQYNKPWTDTMEANRIQASAFAKSKDNENSSLYFQCGLE